MANDQQTNGKQLKVGLAQMLAGGVIMDVVDAEQAKIAEQAGAVLLAREVQAPQTSLGSIDIVVARNAYGRQLDSWSAEVDGYEVAFIRAPRVVQCGTAVQVEARHAGDPVFVREGLRWATTFHPELGASAPSPFHARFAALAATSARVS